MKGLPKKNGEAKKFGIGKNIPVKKSIPNVSKVIVVASGKGGVGKSTVSGKYFLPHVIPT